MIKLDPDQMRERANQYRNEADVVNGVTCKMDSLLQQLQGEWEGEASVAYAEKYQELRPAFQKTEELIRDIAQALNALADKREAEDASDASIIRS